MIYGCFFSKPLSAKIYSHPALSFNFTAFPSSDATLKSTGHQNDKVQESKFKRSLTFQGVRPQECDSLGIHRKDKNQNKPCSTYICTDPGLGNLTMMPTYVWVCSVISLMSVSHSVSCFLTIRMWPCQILVTSSYKNPIR